MTKIVIAVGVCAAIALGIVLIRFNLKRLRIIRCAEAATPEQLETIYAEIERIGTEAPACAVLARTNRTSDSSGVGLIPVPAYVEPWGSRVIEVDAGKDVSFRFSTTSASEPVLRGRVYRLVPVPRRQTKTGKSRNTFAPDRYVAGSPQLLTALQAVCLAYPTELLAYLLASGVDTFEFDPMNQARVGGSPSWVQDAEYPDCDECNKRMHLILQLPGTMLPGQTNPRGTYFFFGCADHPNNTKTVAQFT